MRIAIQGELGSNSHMATLQFFARDAGAPEIVACAFSGEVVDRVVSADVDGAVLPIENSLHGSVAEHYDLLLEQPVRVAAERSLRIRHNVIALPGTALEEIVEVISHPVALAQCRRWQREHPGILTSPFYDTAGGVKHIVRDQLRGVAAIAPMLAAEVYGAAVLASDVQDHVENYTRFHQVIRRSANTGERTGSPDKMTVAFAVQHRPGTLVRALGGLADAGADLTKIESRPVPGRPWEYVFYVDLRFASLEIADRAVDALSRSCSMVKELGRYRAAEL